MSNIAPVADATATVGIGGEYDLLIQKYQTDESGQLVFDADGNPIPIGVPQCVHSQKNLITNTGMDYFGTGSGYLNASAGGFGWWCRVGSGSTDPAFTDTALVSPVASVQGPNATTAWGTGDYLNAAIMTRVYTFAVGAAAGNLTEIGLSSAVGSNLQTRSLFKDAGGTPVTIVVAADEQLIVNYRTIFRADTTDKVFNPPATSPTPTSYTLTLRPANLGTGQIYMSSGVIGAGSSALNQSVFTGATSGVGPVTGVPTGTSRSNSSVVIAPGSYTNGSFERTDVYTIQPTGANYADIGAFMFNQSVPFEWQLGISPRLTKVNPETIKITILNKWVRA